MRRTLLLAGLAACSAAQLAGQSIAVVATANLRPTAVLGPHLRYIVAVDSESGQLGLRALGVPPVVFGSVLVEGIEPGQREEEPRRFADTVRFEEGGRVVLVRADGADRPITIEAVGARTAAGGRLLIGAPRWPLNRVMLVTLRPADIYEMGFGSVGFGVRDHIRVDDRAGMAYLTDSTAGSTTVAVGFGPGLSGRIQSQSTDIVLRRDFGGEVGTERRQIGALTLAVEPSRDDSGSARAVVVFGLGENEAQAAAAARAAGDEPFAAPRLPALHVRTPQPDVDATLRQVLAAAAWQLDWDVLGGNRSLPASALVPAVRARDAASAVPVAQALGDTAAICGSYRLLGGGQPGQVPHAQVALRLGARGRYVAAADSEGSEAAVARLASACARGVDGEASSQAAPGDIWSAITTTAHRAIAEQYGRLAGPGERGGLSLAAAGDYVRAVVGDLFGVDRQADTVSVTPHLAGIEDTLQWQLSGWLLDPADTLDLSYRPADRAARLRLSGVRGWHLVVSFPWLAPVSCAQVRRGANSAGYQLTRQADGTASADIPAAAIPLLIDVTPRPCS